METMLRPAASGQTSQLSLRVADRTLQHAIAAAYGTLLERGRYPAGVLALTCPPGSVDVNVHPAKAEVRFRDRWVTERAVERAVRRALGTGESAAPFGVAPRTTWTFVPESGATMSVDVLQPAAAPHAPLFAEPTAPSIDATAAVAPGEPTDATASAPAVVVPPLIQLRRTWIGFERDDAWVLIDQHSAHERVLYEQFMHGMARGDVASQQLLFPLTLHFTPVEAEAFDENRALFAQLGFHAEAFGGHSVMISAVPAPHPRFDAERCLRDTLASLVGDRLGSGLAKHERLAATVACKAAIKAGDVLTPSEMRALFVALSQTTLPAHDVHGRSTIVQVSWDELERRFGRR